MKRRYMYKWYSQECLRVFVCLYLYFVIIRGSRSLEGKLTLYLYLTTISSSTYASKSSGLFMSSVLMFKLWFLALITFCRFLDEVQSHCSENKMSVQNLATVFGPNILRPKMEDPVTIMEGGETQCSRAKCRNTSIHKNHNSIYKIYIYVSLS